MGTDVKNMDESGLFLCGAKLEKESKASNVKVLAKSGLNMLRQHVILCVHTATTVLGWAFALTDCPVVYAQDPRYAATAGRYSHWGASDSAARTAPALWAGGGGFTLALARTRVDNLGENSMPRL